MAKVKMQDSYSVRYSLQNASTNDTIRTVSLDWENQAVEETITNLNVWFQSIGLNDYEVVQKTKK